ncbi:pyridoxal phosphate-dependent transferase [Phlyctochytrium arcticum]|nr:pyridoxal phosphate-dependent transferase [Phlyctochytrium arcticum]
MASTLGTYAAPLVNDAAKDFADSLVIAVNTTMTVASQVYRRIPGSRIFAKYVKASYQNDPYRTLLEVCLIIFMIWYFGGKKHKPGQTEIKLTEKEIEELIEEWEPESLVPRVTDEQRAELDKAPVIVGPAGAKVKLIDGKERLNFASLNFLGAMNLESTKEKAIEALRKYGVGTCGPCGFYGTIDVHIDLEREIARFMGTEGAIVYSQGFSTIASVIPAFAKRGDIVVADAGVSFAVQKGLQISRSTVKYFKHNDMADLERVLQDVQREHIQKKRPLTRRFIVVEGLYANHGDICPLPQLLELTAKYKFRLMVEESFSLGVLGPNGNGVCGHFGVEGSRVDIIAATFSNALGAAGGFCCGTKEVIEHQRLGGQGYVYSASLPAMLAVSATEGIKYVESHPEVLTRLRENIAVFRSTLLKNVQRLQLSPEDTQAAIAPAEGGESRVAEAAAVSPVIHLQLKDRLSFRSRAEEEQALQEVVDEASRNGVLLTRAKYVLEQELFSPLPTIRIAITAAHTRKEVERAATVVASAVKKVLKARKF